MKGMLLSNLKAFQKEEMMEVQSNFDLGYCFGAPKVDKQMVLDCFLDGLKPNLIGKRKITSKLVDVKKVDGIAPDGTKDTCLYFCETFNKSQYVVLQYKFMANNHIAVTQNKKISVGDKIIIKVISVNVPAERYDEGNKMIDKYVEIVDLVKFQHFYVVETAESEIFLIRVD